MSDKDTAADSAASEDDGKLIKLDQHYEQSTDSESIVRRISLAITLLCSFSATVLSYRRLESNSYDRPPRVLITTFGDLVGGCGDGGTTTLLLLAKILH